MRAFNSVYIRYYNTFKCKYGFIAKVSCYLFSLSCGINVFHFLLQNNNIRNKIKILYTGNGKWKY